MDKIWQRSFYRMVILLFHLVPAQGFAQNGLFFEIGESALFAVKPTTGTSYCWNVSENMLGQKSGETDKVSYLSIKCNPTIRLKWEKAGSYFLSVTANNENGCSNTKTFHVMVGDNHIPVANDDYATTNWLKNIRISLLINDYDAKKDLDSSSLKILSKPELGRISPDRPGTVIYTPLQQHGGTEHLLYSICDSCQQCDTAMVSIHVVEPNLFFPEGISPNGDGMNDRFVINGLEVFPHSSIAIFRRDGIIMYNNEEYLNDWDGSQNTGVYNSQKVPSGTYYYLLHLGGTDRVIRGFIYVSNQ